MNFVRFGPLADWNSYAIALVNRANEMLRREERLNPAGGVVDATWMKPKAGNWGCSLVLNLAAAGSGAEQTAFVAIPSLADPAAASSQLRHLWRRLLDEDGLRLLQGAVPQIGRWEDDGGA